MVSSNDNGSSNVISFYEKAVDLIFSDPTSLLADDIHSELCAYLEDEGYDLSNLELCRDLAVISELIRAALYRYHGTQHDYQEKLDAWQIISPKSPE